MDAPTAAALRSDMTIDITTTGARSGQSRRIEIWFLSIDDRIFITGTPGRRDWFANLRANPALTFHLKESITTDLDATAAVVSDAKTRALVFDHPAASWYRQQSNRDDLMASAPLVELEFTTNG